MSFATVTIRPSLAAFSNQCEKDFKRIIDVIHDNIGFDVIIKHTNNASNRLSYFYGIKYINMIIYKFAYRSKPVAKVSFSIIGGHLIVGVLSNREVMLLRSPLEKLVQTIQDIKYIDFEVGPIS